MYARGRHREDTISFLYLFADRTGFFSFSASFAARFRDRPRASSAKKKKANASSPRSVSPEAFEIAMTHDDKEILIDASAMIH